MTWVAGVWFIIGFLCGVVFWAAYVRSTMHVCTQLLKESIERENRITKMLTEWQELHGTSERTT